MELVLTDDRIMLRDVIGHQFKRMTVIENEFGHSQARFATVAKASRLRERKNGSA